MNNTAMLKYGFVAFIDGEATYDHVVRAKLPYADDLLPKLQCSTHPVIAQRHYPAQNAGENANVTSPIFRHVSSKCGIDSYQSAYYLTDSLTRKDVLPVYLPETGEVKDLMPLLNEEQKRDAKTALQILRARYIKAAGRKPAEYFMVKNDVNTYDSDTIELSDEEMMKIFGRLPDDQNEKVVVLHQSDVVEEGGIDQPYYDQNLTVEEISYPAKFTTG